MSEYLPWETPISSQERARKQYEGGPQKLFARKQLYPLAVPRLYPQPEAHEDPDLNLLEARIIDLERLLVDRLDLTGDETIVDIGSGPGYLLWYLSEVRGHQGELLGIDLHADAYASDVLRISQRLIGKEKAQIELLRANAEDLSILKDKEKKADVVIIENLLYYLSNPRKALEEAVSLLAPGGKLAIASRGPNNLVQIWQFQSIIASKLKRIDPEKYRDIVAPKSPYANFTLEDLRAALLGMQNLLDVTHYFEQSAKALGDTHGSYIAVRTDDWDRLEAALLTPRDNFLRYDHQHNRYESYSDDRDTLAELAIDIYKVINDFIKPEYFTPRTKTYGHYRIDIEQAIVIGEKRGSTHAES